MKINKIIIINSNKGNKFQGKNQMMGLSYKRKMKGRKDQEE